jgi:hypothetical protein
VATEEPVVATCGIRVYRPFRLRNPNVTPCVLEPGHEGKHDYCEKVNAGIDSHSHALHYMREVTRKSLKPEVIFEMKGPRANETYEECAALYQFMEYERKLRDTNEPNHS